MLKTLDAPSPGMKENSEGRNYRWVKLHLLPARAKQTLNLRWHPFSFLNDWGNRRSPSTFPFEQRKEGKTAVSEGHQQCRKAAPWLHFKTSEAQAQPFHRPLSLYRLHRSKKNLIAVFQLHYKGMRQAGGGVLIQIFKRCQRVTAVACHP